MNRSEVSSVAPLGPGTAVGPYEISGHLATGGMGEVYLGRKRGIGGFERAVVLKVMLAHLAHDDRFSRMFIDEARICSQLSHPNIVQVFDLGEAENGLLFLAMEHLGGHSVASCMKTMAQRESRIPVEIVARVMFDAAAGLAYAHEATDQNGEALDLVHRDISPENLFVTYPGPTKILDFGVAKVRDRLAKTQHGEFKGKVGYMAPEIIRGEPVDARSDLFSLGIVLFEMLATRRLFHAPVPATTLHRVLSAPIPDIRRLRDDVDNELADIVHGLLERKRARRIQSADEAANRLETWLGHHDASNKHIAEWLRITFKDAHEANNRIAKLVEQTGKLDSEQIREARRLGGEDLADTLVRELSTDEREIRSADDMVEEAAFLDDALIDQDDQWIRRARVSRWAVAIGVLLVGGFLATKFIQQSIADVRDIPRAGSRFANHFDVTEVRYESPTTVLARVIDTRRDVDGLVRTTPPIKKRRGIILSAINRANVGLEKLADARLPPAHEIGVVQERIYSLYDVAPGRTLGDMIEKEAISTKRARGLAVGIAEALAVAHAAGVVHGAFDEGSIWVEEATAEPRLLGFQAGIATLAQLGDRAAVAPEHKPDIPQDPAVDLYAAAVIIQELLKASDQEGAVLAAGVLTRATAVDVVARYPTGRTFADALVDVLTTKKARRSR